MTRQLDITRMHCHLTRQTTIISLSGVKRYGVCFASRQTDPTDPHYQDIELGPSSHRGHERKHAALHAMGRHSEAVEAFGMMLSTLERSAHLHIHSTSFCRYCMQQTVLIRCRQSFVTSMSMQLPRSKRWSRRLSVTCHVCSSTP